MKMDNIFLEEEGEGEMGRWGEGEMGGIFNNTLFMPAFPSIKRFYAVRFNS